MVGVSSQVENGCQAVAERLLVFVPHKTLHDTISFRWYYHGGHAPLQTGGRGGSPGMDGQLHLKPWHKSLAWMGSHWRLQEPYAGRFLGQRLWWERFMGRHESCQSHLGSLCTTTGADECLGHALRSSQVS